MGLFRAPRATQEKMMVRTFPDAKETLRVAMDETFAIGLAGNPTTGYTWQVDVDSRYLLLLAQEFEPGRRAAGAGGQEVFRFQACQVGETQVTFEYRRPWTGEARDTRRIRVVIA